MALSNRPNRSEQPVYLSPRALAEAIGVSESSLKRWADEGRLSVERTAGGHRRIPLGSAVRFIRQAGLRPVRPDVLGLAELEGEAGAASPSREEGAERLFTLLSADRGREARSLLLALYVDGASLAWLLDGVIRGALARTGELWLDGPGGIFVEHRAVQTCLEALDGIRRLLPPPKPDAPVALGGAVSGDVYQLPSAMAALVVAEAGFRARNLGADTPVEATLEAVRHYRPRLVWQSFSVTPADPRGALAGQERLAGALARMAPAALVLGGRAKDGIPVPARPNVHRLDTMAELAAFAMGVAVPSPAD